MSQAEYLLNSLSENDISTKTEPHIIVGSNRVITVPSELKRIAVQYDHNIETVTFDCPRYWDDHDMSTMKVYINYTRSDKYTGCYLADNVRVDEADDSIMHFDWTISRNVTESAGPLTILVCIKMVDADGNEINHWNSERNTDMKISKGMECGDIIVNKYPDVITYLLADMGNLADLTTEDKSSLVAAINEAAESGGAADAVTYTPQTLTEEQRAQARTNIGAYTKPASGIPKSDLADDVQTSLAKADTALQSQTIPDWNQNDETAPDYVKNRPFYTGNPVETVLVEESTVSFYENGNGKYLGEFLSTFSATVGETYKVSWDGAAYECVCVNVGEGPMIGNLSIAGQGSDTGEPFVMGILNGKGIQIVTAEASASHTVSICVFAPEVVKIDPKYIRDMYYTGDPVETVLVEESTVSFSFNENAGVYMGGLESTFSATVGETYKVSWDGTVYECVCVNLHDIPAIGNLSIAGAGSDTGEPFVMGIFNGKRIQIATADTSASHTISISGFVSEVVKIDEKYLPDTVATKADVEAVQTEAYNAQTTANNAKTTADDAQTTAYNAQTKANNAQTTADDAKTTANNAKTTANNAKTTADDAKTTAYNAQTTANNAKTTADDAKTTADDAQTTAYNAQTKANNAQTTADDAKTTANNAKTTANNAKTTADDAKTTAYNAKSEALDLAARMFGHTSVVDKAFYDDETLSITSLPACIESIGDYAFTRCKNLALTSLPSGITSIGVNAFQGCLKLALTSLPSGLTSIGDSAFSVCTNLALTSLPSGLTSIGDSAFSTCIKLALTSLPSGLTSIGNYVFYGCTKLALTSLPSGLTSIGDYAFTRCTNLALTSLPSGLTSIGDYAFQECTKLALTSLPSGLTSIGNQAFTYCNLTLTSLPSGLTSIGDYAFQRCTGLTSITFTGKPTTINSTAFVGCTNLTTINVPWAEGEVANAPWGATNATINYNYTGA